jgi:hypothetical protein
VFSLFKELHGHTLPKAAENNAWNLLGFATVGLN